MCSQFSVESACIVPSEGVEVHPDSLVTTASFEEGKVKVTTDKGSEVPLCVCMCVCVGGCMMYAVCM